jgi:hypothetical protein
LKIREQFAKNLAQYGHFWHIMASKSRVGAALASLFEEGDPTLSGCPVIFLIVRQGFEITCKPGAGI